MATLIKVAISDSSGKDNFMTTSENFEKIKRRKRDNYEFHLRKEKNKKRSLELRQARMNKFTELNAHEEIENGAFI